VSCCMRDAVSFEERGIPTVILVNEVFVPIAEATAALLALPQDYPQKSIVWLPHPTSNKTKDQLEGLVDERIDEIREKLMGRGSLSKTERRSASDGDPLEAARAAVAGLAASLRADGAELALDDFRNGVLSATLRIGALTCDDGSCILPTEQLERMVDAMVRPRVDSLQLVKLHEIR
jgi:hypothetical protein